MTTRAELIFIPLPGTSHLLSAIQFANRLTDRDDRISITVLVIKTPNMASFEIKSDCKRIHLLDVPQAEPPSPDLLKKSPMGYFTLLVENHIPNVKKLVSEIVSSRSSSSSESDHPVRVTGLVLDFFCISMVDVGIELGLPSYIFFPSNVGFFGLMWHLPIRHDQIGSEFKSSDSDLTVPGFFNPVPVSILPLPLSNKLGYDFYIKLAQRLKDSSGIILNTFYELEPDSINSFSGGPYPPLYTVGPLLDIKGHKSPDLDDERGQKIMKWLDDQPESSVVFLCFGSAGSFSPAQVKEIATGLERSEQRFLWSLRVAPQPDDQTTNGDDHFPEGFLERIGGRGMICGWAPQIEVLAHKATGAFVSHCGWNSTLESLWYGVPIVTWPMYAEQQMNAFRLVKELGLAVELKLDYKMGGGELVTADEITRAVGSVIDSDGAIKKKFKKISEMGRKSILDGGSSFISTGKFIDLNFSD